jgi:hypothetical protein
MERTGVPPEEVEDVYMGCANQAGEDNRDVARMALLLAGFPVEVGGITINRLCGSGLDAVAGAARSPLTRTLRPGPWPRAPGQDPEHGDRRGAAAGDGHRAGARHPEGAAAGEGLLDDVGSSS